MLSRSRARFVVFGSLALVAVVAASLVGGGTTVAVASPAPAEAEEGKTIRQTALSKLVERAQAALESRTRLFPDRSRWENAWEYESQHYRVRTTRSRGFAEKIAGGLETMLAWFRYILGDAQIEGDLFNVWILPDINTYNQMGPGWHSSKYGGFYHSGDASRPAVTYYMRDELRGRQFVTHAALSQYLARTTPAPAPLWIDEGLSCYFELHWGFDNVVSGWNAMRSTRFVPLAQLRSDVMQNYTPEHFLEIGMLFYYLLHEREDSRIEVDPQTRKVVKAPFRDYLRKVLRGEAVPADDPMQVLLTTDLAQLESDFRSYSMPRTPRW